MGDRSVVECVACCAEEEDVGAGGRGGDLGQDGGGVEWGVGQFEVDVFGGEVDLAWVG